MTEPVIATKASNTVLVVCATIMGIVIVASIVTLSIFNKSTDDLFRVLNTIWNLAGILLSSGAFIYAGSAARQTHQVVQQTNGDLDTRIEDAVRKVVRDEGLAEGPTVASR